MLNQKGKTCLVLAENIFYKTSQGKNYFVWHCAEYYKSNRCKVTCKTQGCKVIKIFSLPHNHAPHVDRIRRLSHYR